jgi:hypothetical protein
MSPSDDSELSIHELARRLGIDRALVRRNVQAGMPRTLEGARSWRAARVRPYTRPSVETPDVVPMPPPDSAQESQVPLVEGGGIKLLEAGAGEDLGAVVQWLRDLAKSYWSATTEALQRGDTARADSLCRQLQSLTRNLASTEKTWKATQEQYGGLVSRDTMIRFWMLYKKAVDRCVMELPESDTKARLVDTLDRITMQFSVDLKMNSLIA